jgi:hypothetical protein
MPARWATASLGTNNYVVTVGLGTPARYFTVEFDTGSDLSWVQCKPCGDCYEQHDPLFDPAKSPTYSTVPSGARECRELGSLRSGSSSGGRCMYEVVYADESVTDGELARDTLTLATPADTIPGFVFGCGRENTGTFGTEDGLIGLGRKGVSLASQAAGRYGPGFSYCLPSLSSGTGYLALGGSGAAAAPANAQFTPMVPNRDLPSQYFVRLVGVRVAGRVVKIPAASMLVDSGTQLTNLPDGTFNALWSAFARLMMGKYRRAPGLSYLAGHVLQLHGARRAARAVGVPRVRRRRHVEHRRQRGSGEAGVGRAGRGVPGVHVHRRREARRHPRERAAEDVRRGVRRGQQEDRVRR